MFAARVFLILSAILLWCITVVVTLEYGLNWPAVLLTDLQAMNWRTQFDVDFLVYLVLVAVWVAWKERWGARGLALGFACFNGGVFVFPYLLFCVVRSDGDPRKLLLGARFDDAR